jgi:hypothetical protein
VNKKLEAPEDSKQVAKSVTWGENAAAADPLNPHSHKM